MKEPPIGKVFSLQSQINNKLGLEVPDIIFNVLLSITCLLFILKVPEEVNLVLQAPVIFLSVFHF